MTNGERIITIPRANSIDVFTMAGIVKPLITFYYGCYGQFKGLFMDLPRVTAKILLFS